MIQTTSYDPTVGFLPSTTRVQNDPAPADPQADLKNQLYQRMFNRTLNPVFDQNMFNQNMLGSAQNQRQALGDIYGNQLNQQVGDFNRMLAPQRSQMVNELAARGVQMSPAGSSSLDRFETNRAQGIGDIVRNLGSQMAQGQIGVESGLQNNLLRGSQLGSQLGLQQQGMQQQGDLGLLGYVQGGQQYQQDLAERMRQYNDQASRMDQQSRDAITLGKMQADASQPGVFGQVMQGIGGLGSLAGGIGGLLGGIGQFRSGGQ